MQVSFIGLGVMGFPMAGHLISKNNNLKEGGKKMTGLPHAAIRGLSFGIL